MKKRHSGFSQKFDHDKIHYHYFLILLQLESIKRIIEKLYIIL